MALLDIGEAALAQHAIHDACHRVQVINDQHRIDIVDQDCPLQAALPAIASSNPHTRRQQRRAGPAPVIYMIRSEIKSPGQTGWQFNLFCAAFGGWR
jgi:hypothetical protein